MVIYVALCTENGQNRGTPAEQLRGWAFKLKLGLDEEEFGARQHDRPNENRRNADCIFSLRYCSSLCCCVLLAIAAETEACCSCQRVFEAFISKIDTAPGRQCENPFFVLTNAHHTATRTNDSHLQQSLTHHVTSIRGRETHTYPATNRLHASQNRSKSRRCPTGVHMYHDRGNSPNSTNTTHIQRESVHKTKRTRPGQKCFHAHRVTADILLRSQRRGVADVSKNRNPKVMTSCKIRLYL